MMSKTVPPEDLRRGRPRLQAPPGYTTLADAAQVADVSYSTAYKAATRGDLRTIRDGELGSIFVLSADVKKLSRSARSPSYEDEGRRAVQLRPSLERYALWEKAAKREGKAISVWLGELGDRRAALVK